MTDTKVIKRKRIYVLIPLVIVLGVCALIFGIAWLERVSIPNLSKVSTRLFKIYTNPSMLNDTDVGYQWLSNDQIIVPSYYVASENETKSYLFSKQNSTTNQWEAVVDSSKFITGDRYILSISPDTNTLIIQENYFPSMYYQKIRVVDRKSKKNLFITKYHYNSRKEYCFLDNQSILESDFRKRKFTVYSLSGKKLRLIEIQTVQGNSVDTEYYASLILTTNGTLLTSRRASQFRYMSSQLVGGNNPYPGHYSGLMLLELNLLNPMPTRKFRQIKPPINQTGSGVAYLSKQCDKILWVAQVQEQHPLAFILDRIPMLKTKPTEIIQFWVTDIEGQKPKLICKTRGEDRSKSNQFFSKVMNRVQWRPDGQAFSYLLDGTVYEVPLPPLGE